MEDESYFYISRTDELLSEIQPFSVSGGYTYVPFISFMIRRFALESWWKHHAANDQSWPSRLGSWANLPSLLRNSPTGMDR